MCNFLVLNQLAQNQIVIQREPVKIENVTTTPTIQQNLIPTTEGKKVGNEMLII